ncbi:MAG: RNA polymerase sigma-70 factor [Aeromicrobium sp.]
MTPSNEHAERFTHLRPLLFTIAYEILGSAAEAEDVLQDSYLRWAEVDLSTVRDTKAYVARLVTRQALNARRAAARRREDYVGPWLPEPLLIAEEGDPSSDALLAESVSMAMLIVLETLTPTERAVFVLRDVFGFDYDDIAAAVGKSVDAVRQVAHRAHEHVQARRKKFEPASSTATKVTEQFLLATASGDVQGLMELLAPDVVWTADGGGKVSASRRPVVGADRVARIAVGLFKKGVAVPGVRAEMITCNNLPAVAFYVEDVLDLVMLVESVDGLITNVYAVRNPDKLSAMAVPHAISR